MGQNTYLRILGIVYIVAFKPQRVEEMSGARDILIYVLVLWAKSFT